MRRLAMLGALLAVAALAAVPAAIGGSSSNGTKTWEVTIENLTSGQPLSPPLVVVHTRRADVWSVGDIASHGVAALAEDANNSVLESALPQLPGIRSVTTVPGGPIPPGESRTFEVETRGHFDRLSLLTMLVNTNDAFTGLDSMLVRGQGKTVMKGAYDAGSELNNELVGFIPGPCCNSPFVRAPEGELIRPHAGITGAGDLDPAVYGWSGDVVEITVERIG